MKKYFTALPIVALLFFNPLAVYGQQNLDHFSLNADGSIGLLTFKSGTTKQSLSIAHQSVGKNINKLLKLPETIELKFKKAENGIRDFVTEYYDTSINGYPIAGGEYRINYKGSTVISISGKTFLYDQLVDEQTVIAEQIAFDKALKSINAKLYAWEAQKTKFNTVQHRPVGELVYLPLEQSDHKNVLVLAYKFDITALEPFSRDYVYIDAATGLLLKKDPIAKHVHASRNRKKTSSQEQTLPSIKQRLVEIGNAATRYSGLREINTTFMDNAYVLFDNSRGVEISTVNANRSTSFNNVTEFEDQDNHWTAEEFDNAEKDNAALDAHWGVTKTYDYFKDTFNRNSYDNNGANLLSLVHYDLNYENAAWGGSYMVYGDGNTTFHPLTSLDVTAHELGHAVCQETADLVYQRESGGLNEGFSDIWAAIVEHKYAPEKQAFLIGEEISKRSPFFMRSMSNPKQAGDPDTYQGINWVAANVDEGCIAPIRDANDYCGVHTNSGVLNHWFYILVMGKSGTNDKGNTYNVSGIGWEDAAQIVYRLETAYLTPYADYWNARNAGIQAAKDLFGEDSPQVIATQNAFYAVGIGGQYQSTPDTTPPSAPANLIAFGTTGNATTLTWDAASDANGVWGYIIERDGVEVARTTQLTYRVDGLVNNTTYGFTVKAYDTNNNLSSESNAVSVTTTDLRSPCTSTSGSAGYFRIKNVKLNTIEHTSTLVTGYEDFAYITTELVKDQTYELIIEPEYAPGYNSIALNYEIYFDYNNTGFFNANKKIASIAARSGIVTTNITLPQNALVDRPLRLRIAQVYSGSNQTSTGCNNFYFGQVEDYGIIARNYLATNDVEAQQASIYPNPVQDILHVDLLNKNNFDFEIINAVGGIVKKGTAQQKIDVQSLSSGVYILRIQQEGHEIVQKFIKK